MTIQYTITIAQMNRKKFNEFWQFCFCVFCSSFLVIRGSAFQYSNTRVSNIPDDVAHATSSLVSIRNRIIQHRSPLNEMQTVCLSMVSSGEKGKYYSKNKDALAGPGKKRKKKNKYANFSKTDRLEVDPLESLIQNSKVEMKKIEIEKTKKRNKKDGLFSEEDILALKEEKRERNKFQFPDNRDIDPYDPTTYGYTELGTIVGAHGVRGLVKVAAVTEFKDRLCKPGLRHIKAVNRRSPREIRLMEGRHRINDEYLVKIEGVGDREAAKKLRGSVLYARQEERPDEIESDEYLITELVGCEVYLITGYGEDDVDVDDDFKRQPADNANNSEEDEEETVRETNKFVGTVGALVLADDMCTTAGIGQDLLELVLPKGPIPSWKDQHVLIPFVPQLVPIVDIERRIIYINPPPGLLDLTYIKEEKVRIKGYLPEKSSYKKSL